MRLRRVATAGLFVALLAPAPLAQAVQPVNIAVATSQLRAFMVQRHDLVTSLAARDAMRGQALTLAALGTADAVLSADAASLDRAAARLQRRLARATRRRPRVPARAGTRPKRAAVVLPFAPIAAPGALWSPATHGASPAATLAVSGAARARPARQTAAPATFVILGVAHAAWPALLSDPSSPPGATSHGPRPRVERLDLSSRPDAPSYGRLMIDGGAGSFPSSAANPLVLAAIRVPVALPAAPAAPPHPKRLHPGTRIAPGVSLTAQLAVLRGRLRAVDASLAQVRALETWARATAPTPAITANDVLTSTAVLRRRLDVWTAAPPITAPAGAALPAHEGGMAALPEVLGATVALSSAALGSTLGVTLDGAIVARGNGADVTSRIVDVTSTGVMSDRVDLPIALAALPPVTSTTPATSTTPSPGASVTPAPALSLSGVPATPVVGASGPTPVAGAGEGLRTGGTLATAAGMTATMTATAPLTSSGNLAVAAAPTPGVTLALSAIGDAPIVTMTAALTDSAPLTLAVTLPMTAARSLAPVGFLSDRGTLESVLRQGQALYESLQAREADVESNYRARLAVVAAENSDVERRWLARLYAFEAYQRAFPAYERRVAAFDAYAHRMHVSKIQHDLWVARKAAWDRYAQALKDYNAAVASRATQAPPSAGTAPISGTTAPSGTTPVSETAPVPAAPLPPKPVAPPYFPGPEPAPFVEAPAAWPGAAPLFVLNPGPQPSGYPLPTPPAAVPPWDGDIASLSILSDVGVAIGVGAAGYEETTQGSLLTNGALDDLPTGYEDPIKGVITTYWGGHTVFQSFHPGVDIAASLYTPIHAAAAGKVVWAGYAVPGQRHESYGNCVIIQHNSHFSTLYAHMDDLRYGLQVHVGDIVRQDQVIGYEGLTGWTTGPHLHFEIRDNNVQVNPLLLIPNPQN